MNEDKNSEVIHNQYLRVAISSKVTRIHGIMHPSNSIDPFYLNLYTH